MADLPTPMSFDDWWNTEPKDEAGIGYGLDEYHMLREGWRACIQHRARPLERELAAAEQRAKAAGENEARYLWLRCCNQSTFAALTTLHCEQLDAAIDAARSKDAA